MRIIRPLVLLLIAGSILFGPVSLAKAAPFSDGQQVAQSAQDQAASAAKQRGEDVNGENIDPITGQQVKKTSVVEYVNDAYNFLAIVGGLVAVLMLIYAGYRYMTSYGDPEKIADAKDIVEKSLIGLGLLILAALILNTINPRTAENPCRPGETGCGDIDFSRSGGGTNQIQPNNSNQDQINANQKNKTQNSNNKK
ncbi:hypothetical protein EXS54_02930 [Patescibacteria group bacterium]|nr:hypothetical protein [Patescibacteria group bacterium]